eukprot:5667-Heterococcus_DN1.PRE.1
MLRVRIQPVVLTLTTVNVRQAHQGIFANDSADTSGLNGGAREKAIYDYSNTTDDTEEYSSASQDDDGSEQDDYIDDDDNNRDEE